MSGCTQSPLSTLDPASPQAGHIADVWQVMAWGSLSVLLMMLALVVIAVRARSTSLNGKRSFWLIFGGGVLFPLSVMAALLAYAYLGGPATEDGRYRVRITAHQWYWEVFYPGGAPPGGDPPKGVPPGGAPPGGDAGRYSVNVLHLPKGEPVTIELHASDVIHSFWVPRLGGKMDAIPGRINRLVYYPEHVGVYQGQCAEYCGEGHAAMHFQVIVHEKEQFEEAVASLPTVPQGRP